MSDSPLAGLEADVADDVRVAGAAAVCTVGLTLALRYVLEARVGLFLRLSPLFVYFAYLVFGKGDTGSAFEDVRLWVGLAVATALGVFVYGAVSV